MESSETGPDRELGDQALRRLKQKRDFPIREEEIRREAGLRD